LAQYLKENIVKLSWRIEKRLMPKFVAQNVDPYPLSGLRIRSAVVPNVGKFSILLLRNVVLRLIWADMICNCFSDEYFSIVEPSSLYE